MSFFARFSCFWLLAVLTILPQTAFSDDVRSVPISVDGLLFNAADGMLYGGVVAGANANSIIPINPQTAALGTAVPLGARPTEMVISSDGRFLDSVLSGGTQIRRFDTTTQSAGIQWGLGRDYSELYAEDLAALPGSPGSVLVSRANSGLSPRHKDIVIFDNGVLRETSNRAAGANKIAVNAAGTRLYGYFGEISSFDFVRWDIDDSGFPNGTVIHPISGFNLDIKLAGDRVYASNGVIFNPETGDALGNFSSHSLQLTVADAVNNRLFTASQTGTTLTIGAQNLSSLAFLGSISIPNVDGGAGRLVRWSNNGLAFRTDSQVFLVRSGLVNGTAPFVSSVSPNEGTWGTSVVIGGRNFLSTSSIKFNGLDAEFRVDSDSKITAIVPTDATTGPITVTTAGGSAITPTFTVLAYVAPSLSIGDASVIEGQSGEQSLVFPITLSRRAHLPITVTVAATDGTATLAQDFRLPSTTLTIPAGQNQAVFSVLVTGDTTNEPNETFFLDLSEPTNATLENSQGTGTILNDDLPVVSVTGVTLAEGNAGTKQAIFSLTLSPASPQTVTVNYETRDGTATAGSDYTATNGTVTFAPNTTVQTIEVPVVGDAVVEMDENFFLYLSRPSEATLANVQVSCTIADDDALPLVVTTSADVVANDGLTSLREAITFANSHIGADKIHFQIPLSDVGYRNGAFHLLPSEQLPTLSDDFTSIDGATQTAFTGDTNTQGPEIVLTGFPNDVNVGLRIEAGRCVIKNLVINGFSCGIQLWGSQGHHNQIAGCYIGTDASGTKAVRQQDGVQMLYGASNNLIGGESVAERNVISGYGTGIFLFDEVTSGSKGTSGNQIKGNYIGTNALGTAALSTDSGSGIGLTGNATGNVIGGTKPSQRNIISGNYWGIIIYASQTRVQGNFIGTNALGTAPVGNRYTGIEIGFGTDTLIGGAARGAGNRIAHNGWDGVFLTGLPPDAITTGNRIQRNLIYNNGGLGINLNYSVGSVTPNDVGDGDVGPNNFQNFPIITGATISSGGTQINGTLNSSANSAFEIEIFGSESLDAGGYGGAAGEGETFLGAVTVATDGSGNGTFSFATRSKSSYLTATATRVETGDTSEFGPAFEAIPRPNSLRFSPATGPVGTSVTLDGANLQGATSVKFNGKAAQFSVSGASLTALVPLGATSGPISVTTPFGSAQSVEIFTVIDLPWLSIGDIHIIEGDGGKKTAEFTATLSRTSAQKVTFDYATANGTAESHLETQPGDYGAKSGALSFAPGQTSKTIAISIFGDELIESDETFSVNLSRAENATIADSQGVGTIKNNDFPTLQISDMRVTEGNQGNKNATFIVTMALPYSQKVSVAYSTSDGSAKAGLDYGAKRGTLIFTPGAISKAITIPIAGDLIAELDETFFVHLADAKFATIADGKAMGVVVNDDEKIAPAISILAPLEDAFIASLPSISGGAIDNQGGSGLSRVEVYLQRSADNRYWMGSAWSTTTPFALATTLSGGIWARNQGLPIPVTANRNQKLEDGAYLVSAHAYDRAGNSRVITSRFTVDKTPPASISITVPKASSVISTLPSISGTALDNSSGSGIARVEITLRRNGDSKYWTGSLWNTAPISLSTTLQNGTWKRDRGLPLASSADLTKKLSEGAYTLSATAFDKAGNVKAVSMRFNVKFPPPA